MVEKTLNDLFYDTLKDIYFAERQILKTLPKLAKAAKSEELKSAFLTHRDETEGHPRACEGGRALRSHQTANGGKAAEIPSQPLVAPLND